MMTISATTPLSPVALGWRASIAACATAALTGYGLLFLASYFGLPLTELALLAPLTAFGQLAANRLVDGVTGTRSGNYISAAISDDYGNQDPFEGTVYQWVKEWYLGALLNSAGFVALFLLLAIGLANEMQNVQ